ncbi:hypothetical protein [Streptomyces sp. NPDC054783]
MPTWSVLQIRDHWSDQVGNGIAAESADRAEVCTNRRRQVGTRHPEHRLADGS